DAWRVAAGVATPFLLFEAAFHLPGADDDEIAASDRDVLVLGTLVEFIVGNALAVLQPVDAAKAGDVQQHAAAHHLVLGMLDAEDVQALGVDQLGIVAVVGLVLVEDVPERVPMRRALDAQVQRVVRISDLVPVLPAGDGVGPGREHLMDRVVASSEQAGLRPVAGEGDSECEFLAGADEACGPDDVLGRHVVERADLVVLAPAPPVLEFLRGLGDRSFAHFDIHPRLQSSVLRCDPPEPRARVDCGATGKIRPRKKGYIRPSACRMRCGVNGISVSGRAPSGRSASLMAFITAPGAPAVPASPAPLAPNSESAVGVTTCPTSMSGISAAIGTK